MIDFGWRSKLPIKLGKVMATPAALEVLKLAGADLVSLLIRHAAGDWSDLPPEDARANQDAVLNGERVMSVFPLPTGATVCVITEADRLLTMVLAPEDYEDL